MDTEKHAPWNKAHFLFFQMWLFGVSIRQNSSNVLPKITNHHQPIQILILSLMCLESHQTITPTPPPKKNMQNLSIRSIPFLKKSNAGFQRRQHVFPQDVEASTVNHSSPTPRICAANRVVPLHRRGQKTWVWLVFFRESGGG